MTVSEIIPPNDRREDLSGIKPLETNKLQREGINNAYLPPKSSALANQSDADNIFSQGNDPSDSDDSSQNQNDSAIKCEHSLRQEYLKELKELENKELEVLANARPSAANLGRIDTDIDKLSQFVSNPGAAAELSKLQSLRAIYKEQLLNNGQIELS